MKLWDVRSFVPFDSGGGFLRDEQAAIFWCVWIKAEFSVRSDGRVVWAGPDTGLLQEAPRMGEGGDPGPVLEEADRVLPRAATDITVEGRSLPARSEIPVTVSVGDWSKTLIASPATVWRDRRIEPLPEASSPVPLAYASGFGGQYSEGDDSAIFEDNPDGTGFAQKRAKDEILLPRLRYPEERWSVPGDKMRPAAFAPVARHWPARSSLAGTYDTDWQQTRSPLLPRDFKPEFWQAAPRDQRADGHLAGGEPVRLRNVQWRDGTEPAPDFALPRLDFAVETRFDGQWHPQPLQIQALHLKPDAGCFSLTWMTHFDIGAAANDIKLSESEIRLSGSSGFAVAAEHTGLFHGARLEDA